MKKHFPLAPLRKRAVTQDGRSEPAIEPYASIPPRLMASTTFRNLSGLAVRLLLLMEAAYDPTKEWFVPQLAVKETLGASPNKVVEAFRELNEVGIIEKTRDGWRPGKMGSKTQGRAALYKLVHREKGHNLQPWSRTGDPSPEGYWRVHVGRLRSMAARLSGPAAKLWAHLHACDRRGDGGPYTNDPVTLVAGSLSEKLGLSKATVQRAIHELLQAGVIEISCKGTGRAATHYSLTQAETKGVQRRRMKRDRKKLACYRDEPQTGVGTIAKRHNTFVDRQDSDTTRK